MDQAYLRDAMDRPVTRSMTAAYQAQAGGSISPYSGMRYMKGSGFFGRILKSGVMPLINKVIPYISRAVMPTIQSFAQNMVDGQSFKEAGKRSLKKGASHILDDVSGSLQDGSGIIGRIKRQKKKMSRKCKTISATGKRRKGRKRLKRGKRSESTASKVSSKRKTSSTSRKKSKRTISPEHRRRLLAQLEKARKVRKANLSKSKKTSLF